MRLVFNGQLKPGEVVAYNIIVPPGPHKSKAMLSAFSLEAVTITAWGPTPPVQFLT